MEIKTNQQITKPASINAKEAALKAGQWTDFFGDIKSEFKKISWTSPAELQTYTKIVVGMTFFLGMGIYMIDVIIQLVLNSLNYIMRFIAG